MNKILIGYQCVVYFTPVLILLFSSILRILVSPSLFILSNDIYGDCLVQIFDSFFFSYEFSCTIKLSWYTWHMWITQINVWVCIFEFCFLISRYCTHFLMKFLFFSFWIIDLTQWFSSMQKLINWISKLSIIILK